MEGYGLVVTFVLEEASWSTPVVFDNFVGYTDGELAAALTAKFPIFEGSAPNLPSVLDRMAAALAQVVRPRHPAASVACMTATGPGPAQRLRFRVELPGRTFPICRVTVNGVADGPAAAERVRALVGADCSRTFVEAFADCSLVPVAQAGGHHFARVTSTSVAQTADDGRCTGGVDVVIAVQPGAVYTWGRVAWVGVAVERRDDVARLQRIRDGDPAEAQRLQETMDAATKWYRSRGHMSVRVTPIVAVDEARLVVGCDLSVAEGPRFRFGNLEIAGLEPELAARVRDRWTLAPGQFYDGDYTRQFVAQTRETERAALAGRTDVAIRERPDEAGNRVDVVLEFSKRGGDAPSFAR
jgi:hypothetical protein